jgi:hypothetical protein
VQLLLITNQIFSPGTDPVYPFQLISCVDPSLSLAAGSAILQVTRNQVSFGKWGVFGVSGLFLVSKNLFLP